MNYVLLLEASTGCLADNRTIVATESVKLAAKVYQPLGPADAEVTIQQNKMILRAIVSLPADKNLPYCMH